MMRKGQRSGIFIGLVMMAMLLVTPTAVAATPTVVPKTPTTTPTQIAIATRTRTPAPSPVHVGVYALLNQNTVVALNPSDGSVRWRHPLTIAARDSIQSLQAAGDFVAIVTLQGTLTILNSADGTLRWQIKGNSSSVWATDKFVFQGHASSSGFAINALNPVNGKECWSFLQRGVVLNVKMIGDAIFVESFVIGKSPNFFVLNARDGKERWHLVGERAMVVDYGTVYAATSNTLFALRLNDGTVRWHIGTRGVRQFWGPVIVNGVVFVTLDGYQGDRTNPALLYAINANNGKLLWQVQPSPSYGANILGGKQGIVYATAASGSSVYAFNASNGKLLWKAPVGATGESEVPSLMSGMIYVYAFSPKYSASSEFDLIALNAITGQEIWRSRSGVQVVGRVMDIASPLAANGVAYVYTTSGGIAALDGKTGHQLWKNSSALTNLTVKVG